ncbi:hypothetical protein AMATHDRAFT_79399 [Amanita thiersii Skay4041]|uniref:Uncharacterized protein n=1 Tax=Amanita thiersii Skay4041 TaxID=703135 RepID=A0A2A9NX89_9AGAR|nr:hypothetical protein AMATHDRAFT_79399 [Amanita thiersii Skay4041]
MGRIRRSKKKDNSKPVNSQPQTYSVQALVEKAQALIVQYDYELALKFARRILETEPNHVEATEMLGICLLETGGDLETAKQAFTSLLTTATPPPPSAHLYLAQLIDDDPRLALQHYSAAVDILTAQLKGKDRETPDSAHSDEVEIKSNIVRALIGQVEIWMDPGYDLCFEPEAEKTCEDLLSFALQVDPGNSEALQSLASVRMSQQRPEDAKQCLEQAWSSWKDLELDDPKVPTIPDRLSIVKLFLELSLYTPALLVLQGIMAADDQEVEAWYLEGWCFFLMSEQAQENGGTLDELTFQELAKDARDCLETCRILHAQHDHPDKPLLGHVKELITKLEAQGIKPSSIRDELGEDEEWDDVEESEDDDGDVEMD